MLRCRTTADKTETQALADFLVEIHQDLEAVEAEKRQRYNLGVAVSRTAASNQKFQGIPDAFNSQ